MRDLEELHSHSKVLQLHEDIRRRNHVFFRRAPTHKKFSQAVVRRL